MKKHYIVGLGIGISSFCSLPGLAAPTSVAVTASDGVVAQTNETSDKEALADLVKGAREEGFEVSKYQAILDNESSTEEDFTAALAKLTKSLEVSRKYEQTPLGNYRLLFESDGDFSYLISGNVWGVPKNTPGIHFKNSLTATFETTEAATVCYFLEKYKDKEISVFIDGKEIRAYEQGFDFNNYALRFYDEIGPGKHIVEWKTNGDEWIYGIGAVNTPLITVNLLEPGSLGTEILYNVDHLKDVRKLKVIGEMNDDDWEKIDMMNGNLFSLDLSETNVTLIKGRQFEVVTVDGNRKWIYLHDVKLPEGLLTIGNNAFYGSSIEGIDFPPTLKRIGESAFCRTSLEECILPNSLTEMGMRAFGDNELLKKVKWSENLPVVPKDAFSYCSNLEPFDLPDCVTQIGSYAFYKCLKMGFSKLPANLESVGDYAFADGCSATNIVLPDKVTDVQNCAFNGCGNVSAVMPMSYAYIGRFNTWVFGGSAFTDLYLKSATMVKYDKSYTPNPTSFTARYADVTLHVPSHLVNSYKLDPEWYKYKEIVGFDCDDVKEWTLKDDLTLTPRDRFKNTPSVYIDSEGSLKVNGTDPMPLNNLVVVTYPDSKDYGRIFSNADGVTVGGELYTRQCLGTKNNWYFLSLPYDMKVADIANLNNNPKFAVRYYDGANRAANGASGSWKNYSADDVIPAGTGFIFQASEGAVWKFPSLDNANKQNMTSNRMFVKTLAGNPSENASDRGWNLVGNPYQAWYNIHKLNFTAPITVREKNGYAAYSVIDDDYALAPNQAFFVQCPEGIGSISFPVDGRQMTSEITSQSGVKAKDGYAAADGRRRVLTDITLSDGTSSDRTRVVINDGAADGYETACDASKFMSDDAAVAQLYTIGNDGVRYAINERPEGNGVVRLGFHAGEGGCFALSLTRNMAAKVVLVDNEKGLTVDLMSQDYQFTADAGTHDNRFELRLAADGSATGVDGVLTGACADVSVVDGGIVVRGARGDVAVYTVGGAKAASAKAAGGEVRMRLAAGNYVVKTAEKSFNVVVK